MAKYFKFRNIKFKVTACGRGRIEVFAFVLDRCGNISSTDCFFSDNTMAYDYCDAENAQVSGYYKSNKEACREFYNEWKSLQ